MSESFQRYAIFWLPPADSPLAAFGREWFGTCPERGEVGAPATFGLPEELAAEAIQRPRRYTLHGTVVAPFRPAEGVSGEALADELRVFCARRAVRRTGPLGFWRLSRHLALIPEGGTARLDWLAAEAVTHFNAFRAPTTEADLARYPAEQHSERQRQNVRDFGYPYVLSEFIFHITLAGPLAPEQLDRVQATLAPRLGPLTGEPLNIGDLCLLGEPDQAAPFRLIARCALSA
ncbi:DUF1045 domain-containing protein [Dichotomicrobium thermohalophilum]|uniref:Uncharacterized protein DUF1045 n=1 Tax=Dichotomicrobium thermohalophilum TaxID=933063 RepID=A0A397PPF4_9HYPH|nr:DUF1045 domain-containing protein [Dichotomicrobium thermohalophilum]RIA47621.1 uncharacterized protein DUF1045 [Dichotomicrobium thermohalophilum]